MNEYLSSYIKERKNEMTEAKMKYIIMLYETRNETLFTLSRRFSVSECVIKKILKRKKFLYKNPKAKVKF